MFESAADIVAAGQLFDFGRVETAVSIRFTRGDHTTRLQRRQVEVLRIAITIGGKRLEIGLCRRDQKVVPTSRHEAPP